MKKLNVTIFAVIFLCAAMYIAAASVSYADTDPTGTGIEQESTTEQESEPDADPLGDINNNVKDNS